GHTASVLPSACSVLMVRAPPSSPLFPYTTLFRSSGADRGRPPGRGRGQELLEHRSVRQDHRLRHLGSLPQPRHARLDADRRVQRSEEHTSELQSRENLVCRLLLEKKKNGSESPTQ